MFTGIIEELGRVKNIFKGANATNITVECTKVLEDTIIGDSIAVNGICLTVTDIKGQSFSAEIMPETVRKTGFKDTNILDKVNLERALRPTDRMGGHIVSGHIDGTGVISNITKESNAIWITVTANSDILRYIIMKGSVAIDGTSLTVAYVDDACFKVSLIPLTIDKTVIGLKKSGDVVNIECDMIGKYVEKFVSMPQKKGITKEITMDMLKENGFI